MYDPNLAHSLKYNIAEFSAFKETSFRKQLESNLTKNGEVVPWSEFKKKANELHIEYNQKWLKTEYHQTVATANAAENWREIEANADLYPNAKIVTVNDARVRELHKQWNGLTLPINHEFWKTHIAPFDWGCRCHIVSSDDDVSIDIPEIPIKKEFQNNPANSGKIFADTPYADGLSAVEKKEVATFTSRMTEGKDYNPLVIKEFNNGGKILQSELVQTTSNDYKDVLKCCNHFAKKGSVSEILPTVNIKSPLYKELYGDLMGTAFEGKCPDFRVDGLFYELEGFEGLPNADKLGKMLSRGLKQSTRLVLKDDGSTLNHIKKLVNFAKKQEKLIDEVWIYRANGVLERVY